MLLRIGDQGDAVKRVQDALQAFGFNVSIDGVFGQETEAAVVAFQDQNSLKKDGLVGPETLSALGLDPNTLTPSGTGTPAAVGRSLVYDVPLIAQPDKLSCWAASMAMLLNYHRQESVAPESLAQEVGRSLRTSYSWDMLDAVKDYFGFKVLSLPSNTSLYPSPGQWCDWLQACGPLWVTTVGTPSHAIVVRGLRGDLTERGTTMYVLNPWNTNQAFDNDPIDFHPPNYGTTYSCTYEALASDFGNLQLDNYGNWRIMYI